MIQPTLKMMGDRRATLSDLGPRHFKGPAVPQGDRGKAKKLTATRASKRERCVQTQKKKGASKSRAFAICTASVLGTTKRRRSRS
jgi:hypothetical protein